MRCESKYTAPKASVVCVALLGILWGCANEAQLQATSADWSTSRSVSMPNSNLSDKPRFNAPYPFTEDGLMEKLLEVTAMPEGRVTKKQIESIFSMKFPIRASNSNGLKQQQDETSAEATVSHYVVSGIDWYFDMGIKIGPDSDTEFNFIVSQPSPRTPGDLRRRLPENMCIQESKFDDALRAQGWKRVSRNLENQHFWMGIVTYIKDKKGLLNLGLSPVGDIWPAKWFCVSSIGVFGSETVRARWSTAP